MQRSEVGFFELSVNGKRFNLIASLRNMAKIADSKNILHLYEMIHSKKVPDWIRCNIARDILIACSDDDKIKKYLIKFFRQKQVENNQTISINDQVVVAAALMRHGIAGVNRPEYAGTKGNKKALEKFDINKIVADAMIHFGLSRAEALDLTMSEFCYLLAAKYPSESASIVTPSIAEHKESMRRLMERNNGRNQQKWSSSGS